MVEIDVAHSHIYPGVRARPASGAEGIVASGQDVRLHFADGSIAQGHLTGDVLIVEAYRTGAGSEVPARRWAISLEDGLIVVRRRAAGG